MAAIAAALAATESRGGLIGGAGGARRRCDPRAPAAPADRGLGVFVIAAVGAFLLASPGAAAARHELQRRRGRPRGAVDRRVADGRRPPGGGRRPRLVPGRREGVRARAGQPQFVRLIVDQPHVAHNIYLQQLAETGRRRARAAAGVIAASCERRMRAARRFDAAGRAPLATLARAVGWSRMIGFLTASLFISDSTDKRLWIVLALGPALLVVARRRAVRRRGSRPTPDREVDLAHAAVPSGPR